MNKPSTSNAVYDTTIRLFILLLIVAWCLMIMYPFANIIVWSLILALALFPLHKSFSSKMGEWTRNGRLQTISIKKA